jgi:hypothetical protein
LARRGELLSAGERRGSSTPRREASERSAPKDSFRDQRDM